MESLKRWGGYASAVLALCALAGGSWAAFFNWHEDHYVPRAEYNLLVMNVEYNSRQLIEGEIDRLQNRIEVLEAKPNRTDSDNELLRILRKQLKDQLAKLEKVG